jgi:hypothetical protein
MSSDFLAVQPAAPTAKSHPPKLPPVPSDSSLSSDAGFESTDSKDGEKQEKEAAAEEEEEDQKEIAAGRAQFFVGGTAKSKSARQWATGAGRPTFRGEPFSSSFAYAKSPIFQTNASTASKSRWTAPWHSCASGLEAMTAFVCSRTRRMGQPAVDCSTADARAPLRPQRRRATKYRIDDGLEENRTGRTTTQFQNCMTSSSPP